VQSDDEVDRVCVRNSPYVRWNSTGTTKPHASETCNWQVRAGVVGHLAGCVQTSPCRIEAQARQV
jgi:hypothetical protein